VRTLTFFSVPPDTVTVMPFDGSAVAVPVAGVIVTTGAVGLGEVLAAGAPAECEPSAAGFTETVPVAVHAASVTAVTAAPAISPMRFMPEPFPPSCDWKRTFALRVFTRREAPARLMTPASQPAAGFRHE